MNKNCLFCPWVQDTENPNRYVCLKCQRQRNIDNFNIPTPIFFILAAILGLIPILENNTTNMLNC